MKQRLQLGISTQLAMTPQLKQAIHLLAIPGDELSQELLSALEENPMLTDDAPEREQLSDAAPGIYDFNPHFGGDFDLHALASTPVTLRDFLSEQLDLSNLSQTDLDIGHMLIDSINDDGYLDADCEQIASSLEVGIDEVIAVLHKVQRFDPVGCGARDLKECLSLQLETKDSPHVKLAQKIVDEQLDKLAGGMHSRLCRILSVTPERLNAALELIQSLTPKPGLAIGAEQAGYVVPDVIVYKQDKNWQVMLNSSHLPKLHINSEYAALVKRRASGQDAQYLKEQLTQAKWLLKSLEHRQSTLFKVTKQIVNHQSGFLEHGPTKLVPLTLAQIAEECGLHESTISRVTSNKYLLTPRGTFELKYFFSTKLGNDTDAHSSTSVKAHIQKLISIEDEHNPLSDNEIVRKLESVCGVKVARRTVAKYREAMRIPTSKVRRQLTKE